MACIVKVSSNALIQKYVVRNLYTLYKNYSFNIADFEYIGTKIPESMVVFEVSKSINKERQKTLNLRKSYF